jgi:hypothetical protein
MRSLAFGPVSAQIYTATLLHIATAFIANALRILTIEWPLIE